MTFEEKVRLLASTPPGKEKQELLNKFTFSDPEFTSRYYVDAVTLEKYMEINQARFQEVADEAKRLREGMRNKGWTDKKYQRFTGCIPEPLFTERPEFSHYLPKKIREANIRAFLAKYPAFRVDQ